MLLRLFQTSRRFNVEIQPQLVLLQKTLLNIEGLGRDLDPDLDLWKTAKPYLERWMAEQIGPRGWLERLKVEIPQWSKTLQQLPRLVHQLLVDSQRDVDDSDTLMKALLIEQQRMNKLLHGLLLFAIAVGVGVLATHLWNLWVGG